MPIPPRSTHSTRDATVTAVAPSASRVSISTNESSARYCEVFTH